MAQRRLTLKCSTDGVTYMMNIETFEDLEYFFELANGSKVCFAHDE